MRRKVRKTLHIDPEMLEQARELLKLDTQTDVIARLPDDGTFERELLELLREASPSWKTFRSPLTRLPPPNLRRKRRG